MAFRTSDVPMGVSHAYGQVVYCNAAEITHVSLVGSRAADGNRSITTSSGADWATEKSRLRPDSPPSPPRTPPEDPFKTNHNQSTTPRKSGFPPKISELNAANGITGANNSIGNRVGDVDAGDTPISPVGTKSGQSESAFGPESTVGTESPGRGSPKRHPPKLRRRGSTSIRHSQSPGDI